MTVKGEALGADGKEKSALGTLNPKIKTLLTSARKKGFVSQEAIDDLIEDKSLDIDGVDRFLDLLSKEGIQVADAEDEGEENGAVVSKDDAVADPVLSYLTEIGRFPRLSHREEKLYSQRSAEGDLDARKRMIVSNLRLVVHIAKKFQNRGISFLDLIEEGNLGLIKAVERFDPGRGCRFSTYASWWIRQSIVQGIASQGKTIRVPVHIVNMINAYLVKRKEFLQWQGREPRVEELADSLGLSARKVAEIVNLVQGIKSLDSPSSREAYYQLSELVRDEMAIPPDEIVELHLRNQRIGRFLEKLSDREQDILKLRYGFYDGIPRTLAETGKTIGVTRERIRQIEKKALKRLRRLIQLAERASESEERE
jgi:RNA polymerase primary sigma factor